VNPLLAKAVATGKAHGIGKRTVERSFAKAEGKKPKPKPEAEVVIFDDHRFPKRPFPKPRSSKPVVGLDAARQFYLDKCAEPEVDLDAEEEMIIDALREIAGKRAMGKGGSA
jgi:hypothetical protein